MFVFFFVSSGEMCLWPPASMNLALHGLRTTGLNLGVFYCHILCVVGLSVICAWSWIVSRIKIYRCFLQLLGISMMIRHILRLLNWWWYCSRFLIWLMAWNLKAYSFGLRQIDTPLVVFSILKPGIQGNRFFSFVSWSIVPATILFREGEQ